jgi:uncharacterized membrane protein
MASSGGKEMSQDVPVFSGPTPYIRRVALDRPWVWLTRGWADFQAAPRVSLAYGIGFVAAGFAISLALLAFESIYLLLPLAAGFLLLAPLLAVGLYETSRRVGQGQTPTLAAAVGAFRANPEHMAYMGFVLMLINLFWTRMAMLIFALFFGSPRGTLRDLIDMTLFSSQSLPFLIVGTAIGFVLAATVFAISAVSIPMLLDRPQTPVWVAIATSFVAVRTNLKPMALWAALICAFTGFGMIPMFLGLAVTMPLIGHATWHCYKDLVDVRDVS